jgi:hypothetical protein
MRASFPSFSSRVLAAAGTCALLVLLIVLLTGGFVIEAGPLRFSAHRWTVPLAIAIAAWLGAALHGRTRLRDASAAVTRFLERHATALAILLAAAAAASGIAFGTYAASSADAAGYVSQAYLLGSGRLVRNEPLAREVGWPEPEWTFSTFGYRPGARAGEIVPTYPAGLPLTMAAVRAMAGDIGPFLVVPMLGAVAVLCTYALGVRLHSRTAGLIAAALLSTSPILFFQIVQPMSDVPATAWWTLALVFALIPVPTAPFAAGATAGLAILTRPNLVPLTIVIALAVAGWPAEGERTTRAARQRFMAFAAGLVPAIGALALVNWRLYGSPIASGYGAPSELYDLASVRPNLLGYAAWMIQSETPALVLAAYSVTTLAIARSRGIQGRRLRAPAVLAALTTVLTLACYLPYAVFTDWSYLRFLLPAFPAIFVCVGALGAAAATRFPEPIRGIALLAALTIVCSLNVLNASLAQAFNLHRYESRYRTAGRYLDATLPPNAVIVAVQQSASARHYADRPVLRWDMLRVDLDDAVERLRALDRHPVILIEAWETADLRARFPRSTIARLDWPPRVDVGDETRVRLFDPADRGTGGRNAPTTDRLH